MFPDVLLCAGRAIVVHSIVIKGHPNFGLFYETFRFDAFKNVIGKIVPQY